MDQEPVKRPSEVGVYPARLTRALDVLRRGVLEEGAAPGAVVCAARRGRVFLHASIGTLDGTRPAGLDAVYDLASLPSRSPPPAQC